MTSEDLPTAGFLTKPAHSASSKGVAGIVYSVEDPAGEGIARYLRERLGGRESRRSGGVASWDLDEVNAVLVGFKEDVIYFDFLDEVLPDADFYVILSRHKAESGVKSLTVHHTGNPTSAAEVGGRPGELSVANPPLAYWVLKSLSRLAPSDLRDFEVVYEVTHHGPTSLRKPLTFVEIGSSKSEWSAEKAHEVVGESVVEALTSMRTQGDCVSTVGFGGPHYAEGFTKRALRLNECYGHIISRYAVKELTDSELRTISRLAALKSSPPAVKAVVMRKVGSNPKALIAEVLRSLSIPYEVIE